MSPENARDRLGAFIKGARTQLLVYDPKVGDPSMLRLLTERMNAGVDVRIIGKLGGKRSTLIQRREIGVIVPDGPVVKQMRDVFEDDWALTDSGKRAAKAVEAADTPASEAAVEAAAL